ncbi:MAG: SEC-C metal-binding domain-containing protein [Candidatus Rariloculaceae bacterium]
MAAIGRNMPCPCGSGEKYKRCCANKSVKMSVSMRIAITAVAVCLIGGLVLLLTQIDDFEPSVAPAGRVWSPEHGHYH